MRDRSYNLSPNHSVITHNIYSAFPPTVKQSFMHWHMWNEIERFLSRNLNSGKEVKRVYREIKKRSSNVFNKSRMEVKQ